MSKLTNAKINLLISQMDNLDGDTLLRLQESIKQSLIKKNKDINGIVLGVIKATKKINSMDYDELESILEDFEKNLLIKKNKKGLKDLSLFYDIFELICDISGLEEDDDTESQKIKHDDSISALNLISKFDKMSKQCLIDVKIPEIWISWLKKNISGMGSDGKLLKGGKKKYTKSKK